MLLRRRVRCTCALVLEKSDRWGSTHRRNIDSAGSPVPNVHVQLTHANIMCFWIVLLDCCSNTYLGLEIGMPRTVRLETRRASRVPARGTRARCRANSVGLRQSATCTSLFQCMLPEDTVWSCMRGARECYQAWCCERADSHDCGFVSRYRT